MSVLHVAPAPHILSRALTTRRMMLDVLIGLFPVMLASVLVFREYALIQAGICVASCLAVEAMLTRLRGRKASIGDGSAVVTGLILAFSLPATAPWYVGVIGSAAAMGLGKFIFGGLGQNVFNPAMVGRAFAMMAFPALLAAGIGGYVNPSADVAIVTHATPMTAVRGGEITPLKDLFLGTTNGSLGETSALACLIGGLYLCLRRTASWEIPLGVILAAAIIGGAVNLAHPQDQWTVLHHLLGGALLLGAFFIATDPVTSPLTPKGKFIFGLMVGGLVMLLRKLSVYPEGVMFSILIANPIVPLINRWTIPKPVGGPTPAPEEGAVIGPEPMETQRP